MKIIIQCASSKKAYAGTFSYKGQKVKFVADPDLSPQTSENIFFKPDDEKPSTTLSWRDFLVLSNNDGENPDKLLEAADLYQHAIYAKLADRFGRENLYILSAGWGLIRSDYLIPQYDITFSHVKKEDRWKRRKQNDRYNDFNQLGDAGVVEPMEEIHFFGGRGYLRLFYQLTESLPGKKIVYYRSPPSGVIDSEIEKKFYRRPNYTYVNYESPITTNWHYACAKDFMHEYGI